MFVRHGGVTEGPAELDPRRAEHWRGGAFRGLSWGYLTSHFLGLYYGDIQKIMG